MLLMESSPPTAVTRRPLLRTAYHGKKPPRPEFDHSSASVVAERGVDDEALPAAEIRLESDRRFAAERVHVAGRRALRPGLAEHVGVARVETLDAGAFVAGQEWADQMLLQLEHEHVAVERRPIFLSDHHDAVRCRHRMRAAAGNEVVIVENAVVLVGDLLVHDVLIFSRRHHHQVLERVVQVAGVVHVHVRRSAVPPFGRHVREPLERHRQRRHLAGDDVRLDLGRHELEPLDDVQR